LRVRVAVLANIVEKMRAEVIERRGGTKVGVDKFPNKKVLTLTFCPRAKSRASGEEASKVRITAGLVHGSLPAVIWP
jgi:hypothetical protein